MDNSIVHFLVCSFRKGWQEKERRKDSAKGCPALWQRCTVRKEKMQADEQQNVPGCHTRAALKYPFLISDALASCSTYKKNVQKISIIQKGGKCELLMVDGGYVQQPTTAYHQRVDTGGGRIKKGGSPHRKHFVVALHANRNRRKFCLIPQ